MDDSRTATQLRIIREIAGLTGRRDLPISLRGGWAVDFALGRITRHHDDIDFTAWTEDGDAIQEALLEGGFELKGRPPEPRTLRNFLKYGEGVQVAFVERVDDDTVCPAGHPEYPLPADLMRGRIAGIGGVACRTPPAAALLDTKERKVFWDEGEQYRERDLADMRLLREAIGR